MSNAAAGVFISYRRQDANWLASRLHDHLVAHFGKARVFLDIDGIKPGVDFMQVITEKIAWSRVMLVIIGPQWLDSEGDERWRLDRPDDPVRVELETAFSRDLRVIPLLLDGATMPRAGDLPHALAWLARLNALRVGYESFRRDVARIVETLADELGIAPDTGLPLVRDAELSQLRVHAAQVQVPYVERDVEERIVQALGPGQAVLLVGHSMAGKTRLAAHVVQQGFRDAPLLMPESGKALRDLVHEGMVPAGAVVWLDDLERFLGPDGLTIGLLKQLSSAVLIATIRSQARETYRPGKALRPPEWEVLEAFTQINLQRRNTEAELERIRAVVANRDVLAAVQHYGLAEFLGAGPLAVDKFEHGETIQPLGHALVRAAVDWRRTGLTHPIPKPVLASLAVVTIYLADRPDVPRSREALESGLEWATEEINETVALLNSRFADPEVPTFEPFDYLVDHLTLAEATVPDQMWQLSLEGAHPKEWTDLAYSAFESGQTTVAESALIKAAEAGDSEAMFNLGVLFGTQQKLDK